jgi:hypothetical protein
MITNEREYRIARAELRRFEEDLSKPRVVADQPGVHPALVAAAPTFLNQQLEELRAEIREYEELRSGLHRSWEFSDLSSLPQVLIESRIARGLTQRQLADELKVREQAIQRYEDNRYAGASFERITDVVGALGLYINVVVSLDPQVTSVAPSDIFTLSYLGASWSPVSSLPSGRIGSTSFLTGVIGSYLSPYQGLGVWPSTSIFNLLGAAGSYPFSPAYRQPATFTEIGKTENAAGRQKLVWPFDTGQNLPDLQLAGATAG